MSLKITVLMSCYNGSKWLDSSIKSILNQSYRNFEFIIIDDGSTDNTWEIINSYQIKDNRIVALKKENTGLSNSLNVGLKIASGDWIARIDQDDVCDVERLNDQINYVTANSNLSIIGGYYIETDSNLNYIKRHTYPSSSKDILNDLRHLKSSFPHSSVFFNRKIALKIGGYNKKFKYADDLKLWLDFSYYGSIGIIPKFIVNIRKHQDQMSSINNASYQYRDSIAACVCYELRKLGFKDPGNQYNDSDWNEFIKWIEYKLNKNQEMKFELKKRNLRSKILGTKYNNIGEVYLLLIMILKFNILIYLYRKYFGTKIPKKLSVDWLKYKQISYEKKL